jgi:hypothetical protein
LKILIVEDDDALAKNLERFLSDIAEITVSNDGLEGQMLGQDGIYDLAVLSPPPGGILSGTAATARVRAAALPTTVL